MPKGLKNEPYKGVKSVVYWHYAKNDELAETRVLLQKYSVFWGYSGSKNDQNI